MKDQSVAGADMAQVLNEPGRLAALQRTGVTDGTDRAAFDRAVALAARVLGVPVSLVSIVDTERQHFAGQVGLTGWACTARGTPLSHSFCQHVVARAEPLVVRDAETHPLVQDNPAIADLDVKAYLGVPIRSPDGQILGSLCAIDKQPRDWTVNDQATLIDLAHGLESELRLREALADREMILQEMNHRVKNLFTLIGGMIRMERSSHDDVAMFAASVTHRIRALSDAHALIVPYSEAGTVDGSQTTLGALLETITAPYSKNGGAGIALAGPEIPVGPKSAVYMALSLHELATNANKYGALASDGANLDVVWREEDDQVLALDWAETGLARSTEEPQSQGFGTRLLALSIEQQLRGKIISKVLADCFVCSIRVPMSALAR